MASARPTTCTLFLVRHGHTPTTGAVLPGRAPGLHLSDTGRAQARHVAERITSTATITAVYSSPMERARETAAAIASASGLRVRTRVAWNECDFGDWTGRRLGDLRRRRDWHTVQHRPSGFRFPGGESFSEMQRRAVDALEDLAATHPDDAVVVVSHADVLKAVLAHLLGVHLDLFQRITVSPCSVSVVHAHSADWQVLTVNNTGDDLSPFAPT